MKRITLIHCTAALCAIAWFGSGFSTARAGTPPATRALTAIKTVALPGGKVEVDLVLNQPAPKPLSFSVNRPAMIVLDLDATLPALKTSRREVDTGNVASVATASAGGRTRVVINLETMAPYETRVKGHHVYVIVSGAPLAQAAPASAEKTFGPASGVQSQPSASAHAVTDVSFHRTPQGAGRIEIALSGPDITGTVKREGEKIVINFPGATVPARLQERLNVTDFATPITTIATRQTAAGVRLVVQAHGEFEQLAFQADNTFAVELKPIAPQELAATGKTQYTGKKLTLNFQNIPVRAVLQILAEFTGKNIVVSGAVGGNVTLRLHDVPWDEALAIILKTQGLAMRKTGEVIMIAPAVEFARQEQQRLKARSQVQQLVPLHTAYLQVNYAKAGALAALIQSQKNSLLSARGTVTTDQRTNTLIVRDTSDHIAQVRKLVHVLDIPVRQVLIESRIVVANNDYKRAIGARFGVTGIHQGANSVIGTTGNSNGTGTMINNPLGDGPPTGPYPVPGLGDRLNVNVPAANPVGQFAIAILNSSFRVDLELSAMQAEGKGEVVSSPRVITANQQTARIEQGVEIPYQNASSSGATSVQFKKAVLSLEVTPQITPDDRILMGIEVHNDSRGLSVPTANGGSVPSIDTRVVNTNVLVDNGDTVVIGGIYQTRKNHTVNKVPLLGDIPLLGILFRQTQVTNNKTELLIFVTPKILTTSLANQ